MNEQLKLPAPTFKIVPNILQPIADKINIPISINFSRTATPIDNGILITRANFNTIKKLSNNSVCFIFAAPLEFVRSDGTIKKLKCCIWFFSQNGHFFEKMSVLPEVVRSIFIQHFSKFGVVLYTQKKPADSGDNFQQN